MKKDGAKPLLGASATALGVRAPGDIVPDAQGQVIPGTSGMSVSPTLAALPDQFIPMRLRPLVPSAYGRNTLHVWSHGEGSFAAESVAPGLQLRPDPRDARHGFVEPDSIVSLEEYRDAISATQDNWTIDES